MIVIATGFIPLLPLAIVWMMVMWGSWQFFGKKTVWNTAILSTNGKGISRIASSHIASDIVELRSDSVEASD